MQYDQVLYTPKEGHTVLQFNCSLQSLAFQNEYHAIQVASVNNSFIAGLNTTHLTGRILIQNKLHHNTSSGGDFVYY